MANASKAWQTMNLRDNLVLPKYTRSLTKHNIRVEFLLALQMIGSDSVNIRF